MPRIEVFTIINRPKEYVYHAIKDMANFPYFMRDIKALNIIKRLNDGFISAWEVEVDGAPVKWREEDRFDEINYRIEFNMLEGDYGSYRGSWLLQDCQDKTKIILNADFNWGIPNLEKYVTTALEDKARRGLRGMLLAIRSKLEKNNV